MVCCQGLIGGREKRIIGLWDLNPGLESGPKSALPLNLYFPDHSSIPQEKIIYFFFALRLFSRWQHNSLLLSRIFGADCFLSSPAFPRFLSLASFISRGSPAFTIIPFSCQLHQKQQEHRNRISLCSFREQQHQQIVMLHAFLHTSPPSRKNALPPPPHPPETYKWAEEATKPEEEATRPEGGLHQQPSTNTYFFGNSKQLPPVSK